MDDLKNLKSFVVPETVARQSRSLQSVATHRRFFYSILARCRGFRLSQWAKRQVELQKRCHRRFGLNFVPQWSQAVSPT
jgi:hypothetical protein